MKPLSRPLPVADLQDFLSGDEDRRKAFIQTVGDSLSDIGFFALINHGIDLNHIEETYKQAEYFFDLDEETKRSYLRPDISHQRGYTAFGIEHAKNNPAPDLKEFWQTGRGNQGSETDLTYPANIWPTNHLPDFEMNVDSLYNKMESISTMLLSACSTYLGHHDSWLPEMAREGNTIMRIIHYPPLDESTPEGAVRSAAHEDINLITLLMTATAAGLQVMDHDGTWIDVEGNHEQIIVDSGDMIQNLTNGLFKSTTHRVVNPGDPTQRRFSMPMFVHPRNEIDLTPLEEFVSQTGGAVMYPSIKAGEYLHQRLVEIGLASK